MKIKQQAIKIKIKCKKRPFTIVANEKQYDELVNLITLNEVIHFGPIVFLREDLQYVVYD